MKTKAFFFMVCIWLLTTNGFAQNTIKGDGNIITKEISISDYDEISYVGKVNIKYEQSNASPFFKITIDENILPHLDIKIKGKTLIIQPKNEKKYFNGNSYGLNLQPTVCEIKTSSRELKEKCFCFHVLLYFRLFSFIDERGHITVAYFLYFLMN